MSDAGNKPTPLREQVIFTELAQEDCARVLHFFASIPDDERNDVMLALKFLNEQSMQLMYQSEQLGQMYQDLQNEMKKLRKKSRTSATFVRVKDKPINTNAG